MLFWLGKITIHKKFIIDQLKSIQLPHCFTRTICWIRTCIDKTDYKENDEVHSKITWKTAFLLRGLIFKTNIFFCAKKIHAIKLNDVDWHVFSKPNLAWLKLSKRNQNMKCNQAIRCFFSSSVNPSCNSLLPLYQRFNSHLCNEQTKNGKCVKSTLIRFTKVYSWCHNCDLIWWCSKLLAMRFQVTIFHFDVMIIRNYVGSRKGLDCCLINGVNCKNLKISHLKCGWFMLFCQRLLLQLLVAIYHRKYMNIILWTLGWLFQT